MCVSAGAGGVCRGTGGTTQARATARALVQRGTVRTVHSVRSVHGPGSGDQGRGLLMNGLEGFEVEVVWEVVVLAGGRGGGVEGVEDLAKSERVG